MVTFKSHIKVNGPGYIHIGNYVDLDKDCTLNAFTNYNGYVYIYKKPLIKIEDHVGISQGTFISAVRHIHIKKNVMIGPYCFIGDYNHEYKDISKPIASQPLTDILPIVIEEGAWIGAHVTICPGVTIGRNSIVGANSVVTHSIPDYSLAVGVPAKVIKRYDHVIKRWVKKV